MKRIIFVFLLIIALFALPAYADEVKQGDYIKFGTYNGLPIVWRCVESEDGKALMISDSIITLKAYDAAGDAGNDATGYRIKCGSNLWSSSTLRAWLNSDSDTVSYSGSVPNSKT